MRAHAAVLLSALLVLPGAAAQEKKKEASPAEDPFVRQIKPILDRYCVSCHKPDKKKGDLDLTVYTSTADVLKHLDRWQYLVERVNAFEMPPEKSREPSHDDKANLNRWFERLPRPKTDCTQLASDRTQRFYKGYVMSRRLNRSEYVTAVGDLLGTRLPENALPADGAGGEGFDTNGDTLFTSPILLEKYLDAADQAVAKTTAAGLRARLGVKDAAPASAIAAFARRAFRRPVQPKEVDRLLALHAHATSRGDGPDAALRLALKGVLMSPHFLFLVEPEPAEEGIHRLHSLQIAARLAIFLWSSVPDEELLAVAERDGLKDAAALRAQVRRMLRDRRSKALGEHFALQWLELESLGTAVRPDPAKFPEFDDVLAAAMKAELVHVVHEIVREDRSLLDILDSDYTYVNERLAKLYGLKDVTGEGMRRVTLDDRRRGGVLGMAGVHTLTSYPLRTSPVLRGRWIQEALLGGKVPPPPPDVAALEAASSDPSLTLRQRLEKHRTASECAACHARMDPLGFGLENFDVLGRWRTEEAGRPIDAAGQLPSGEKYVGAAELKTLLLRRKDEVMRHLARKLLGYALGRPLNKFDECVVDDALKALKANGYKASALIETIAASYPFTHRFVKK
ncbi:MAG TPA: DUF1592 domain-containing protein [Planctomycetota bacterium]|nr:DUF1592 domain-containing protein [Planctomycetota bacterium]